MFRSGSFVANHIDPVSEDQIQPNGVDLTVAYIYDQSSPGSIRTNETQIGDREQLSASSSENILHLDSGSYIVQYGETISIPENHLGFVYPRSSLLRNSCMVNTAVWDAGYTGKGEGLLQAHEPIQIEKNARIAQIVFAKAKHEREYSGQYDHENIDSDA